MSAKPAPVDGVAAVGASASLPLVERLHARIGAADGWIVALAFVALILGTGYVRGVTIWPQSAGLRESPYEDEGVYAAAAQLLVQGKHPYRDFVYAHPPLGPLLLTPAIQYHFTAWGSPTTFMILRYLAVAYGAATVGLVFLIGWRVWGLVGGLLGGALLTFDPVSVWAGRHIMLEAPLLFLLALAALAYVFAVEEERAPIVLSLAAGFFAAAAGGVKLQGLVLIVAMAIDLTIRRRWGHLVGVIFGAWGLWLPLWGYLFYLRRGNPLGQFVWLQLLRPADGLVSGVARIEQLRADAPLLLTIALLALVSSPALALRRAPVRRRGRRGTPSVRLRRLPGLAGDEDEAIPEPPPIPPSPMSEEVAPALDARRKRPGPAWSLLSIWAVLSVVTLAFSRSYYAHYGAQLALPLALCAGVLPLAVGRGLLSGRVGRAAGFGLAAAAVALAVWFGPGAVDADFTRHPDRLYEIVARYANDAVGPDAAVFALDAQFPFRAARRPAREEHDRFVVDGYGMLLYHGLRIEGTPTGELLRRALREPPGRDPYAVMWRPAPQERLQASLGRVDLAIIDAKSSGRLTDDTRRWLDAHARLVERQERYAIYRIQR